MSEVRGSSRSGGMAVHRVLALLLLCTVLACTSLTLGAEQKVLPRQISPRVLLARGRLRLGKDAEDTGLPQQSEQGDEVRQDPQRPFQQRLLRPNLRTNYALRVSFLPKVNGLRVRAQGPVQSDKQEAVSEVADAEQLEDRAPESDWQRPEEGSRNDLYKSDASSAVDSRQAQEELQYGGATASEYNQASASEHRIPVGSFVQSHLPEPVVSFEQARVSDPRPPLPSFSQANTAAPRPPTASFGPNLEQIVSRKDPGLPKNLSPVQPAPSFTTTTTPSPDWWSAERARYSFATDTQDKISDLSHTRSETRSEGTVKGSYSYSDGFVMRHVMYLADRNGYRILGESSIPLNPEGPQVNPLGRAAVSADVDGSSYEYVVRGEDLYPRRYHRREEVPQEGALP